MNFYNYYIKLCVDKGVKPSRAGQDIGGTKTMVNGWKAGRALPTDTTLYKLSEYFGVPLKTFYACDDIQERSKRREQEEALQAMLASVESSDSTLPLSDDERELIRCWREANDDEREAVVFALRKHGMPFTPAETEQSLSATAI